jgi:hypothetical protein
MNNITQFEDRTSRSRGMHEGESSTALCDRHSRTRDFSPKQLPTDDDHAVPTREYQTDQSSPILLRLRLALCSKDKNHPTAVQGLTGHSISERFHNLRALSGTVQGGFFLREKATNRLRFRGTAIVEPLYHFPCTF